MGSRNDISPEDELGDETGSDTQYRYRFQAMCAAIFSLLLLKEPPIYEDLFCELQEDILMKKPNGKYVAIQVKTRNPTLDRFKTTDNQIIDTIKKFIALDLKYPNCFDNFLIVTNCGFWEERDNHKNLPRMLLYIKNGISIDNYKEKYNPIHTKLISVPSSTENQILNVLSKIDCQRIADFDSMNDRLARAISEMETLMSSDRLSELDRIGETLTDEMVRASSITFATSIDIYDAVLGISNDEQITRIVNQRRVSKQRVVDVIQQAIRNGNLLVSLGSIDANQIGTSIRTFYDKLEKGGVSEDNKIHLADQKNSAENMLIILRNRRGREYMESVFQHLGMEVRNEWLGHFDQLKRTRVEPFGQELLEELKPVIRRLYETLPDHLKNECNHQQIMGIVGILTETCPIRWSTSYIGGFEVD